MLRRCSLVLMVLFTPIASNAKDDPEKFSMTIPGGVSLGTYQSGVTYTTIEALRSGRTEGISFLSQSQGHRLDRSTHCSQRFVIAWPMLLPMIGMHPITY